MHNDLDVDLDLCALYELIPIGAVIGVPVKTLSSAANGLGCTAGVSEG
ncbi:hypothetical protein [Streptomyces chartreusis]